MAEANDVIDTTARSSLPVYREDVKDIMEQAETCLRRDEGSDDTQELRYVLFRLSFASILQQLMCE